MNISQMNTYASTFIKQIQKTHSHLDLEEILNIMGWARVSTLAINPAIIPRTRTIMKAAGQIFFIGNLSDTEAAEYERTIERAGSRDGRGSGAEGEEDPSLSSQTEETPARS